MPLSISILDQAKRGNIVMIKDGSRCVIFLVVPIVARFLHIFHVLILFLWLIYPTKNILGSKIKRSRKDFTCFTMLWTVYSVKIYKHILKSSDDNEEQDQFFLYLCLYSHCSSSPPLFWNLRELDESQGSGFFGERFQNQNVPNVNKKQS